MKRLEHLFVELNKWTLVLLLGSMSVIVFSNVVLRYVTNFSIVWAEEVARYLMIWMTFLGAGLTMRYGGHVAISNLMEMLPHRGQQVLRVIIALSLICFFAAMVWIAYGYTMRMQFQLTPATRIPFSYIYGAIPVGFALLIVHFLLVVKDYVKDNRYKESADVPGDLSSNVGG